MSVLLSSSGAGLTISSGVTLVLKSKVSNYCSATLMANSFLLEQPFKIEAEGGTMGLHFWMMGWHMILVLVVFRYLCGVTSVTADETILSQEISFFFSVVCSTMIQV